MDPDSGGQAPAPSEGAGAGRPPPAAVAAVAAVEAAPGGGAGGIQALSEAVPPAMPGSSSMGGGGLGLRRRRRRLSRRGSFSMLERHDSASFLLEAGDRRRSKWSPRDLAESYFRSASMQLSMLVLSIFSCILFVAETYQHNYGIDNVAITLLECIVSVAFLLDYILTVVFALDRWRYIVSFNGMVDLVSILPIGSFLAFHMGLLGPPDDIDQSAIMWLEIGNLCRILRGLKVFRIMRIESADVNGSFTPSRYSRRRITGPSPFDDTNSVSSRVVKLVFWLVGTIYITTSVVWFIDKHEHAKSFALPADIQKDGMTWLDALYFVSITLATVGYGDIVPSSTLSRIVVIGCVFFFLCTVPYQIGKLMEALSSRSIYRTACFRPVRNTEHILILGRVTYPVLASFIEQFLHGDKILEHHFRLVVLSPKEPDPWLHSLLQHPRYHDRVMYLQGSPYNPEDLARACAGQAQGIFIAADFQSADIQKDADRILLTAVAARKYLIRQYDYDLDEDDDGEEEGDNHGAAFKAAAAQIHGGLPSRGASVRRQASGLFSLRSPAVGVGGAVSAPPSLRRLGSSQSLSMRSMPPLLGQITSAPSFMHGALETLGKGLLGLHLDAAGRREALEGDDEISDRIVIQTHSTGAMEELSRGLGFHRTYCPHVLRLRLMAYGTCYPGIMSWVMNLLRGDPFLEEDAASSTPMPAWYRAFRAGAQQRIVRYHVDVGPGSRLEGRTFAEIARYLYRWFGVLAVAVELSGVFLLNPHRFFRFSHARAPSVLVYFIAPGVHTVREALEALHHSHWDGMDLASTLAEVPRVELKPSDLPPPRTESLQRSHLRRAHEAPAATGLPHRARSLGGTLSGSAAGGGNGAHAGTGPGLRKAASVGGESHHHEKPPLVPARTAAQKVSEVRVQEGEGKEEKEQQQSPRRPRSQSVGSRRGWAPYLTGFGSGEWNSLSEGSSPSHHDMLAAAHRLLKEAHEAHETHRAAQQWQQLQALGVGLSGLRESSASLAAMAPEPPVRKEGAGTEVSVGAGTQTAHTDSAASIPRLPTPPSPGGTMTPPSLVGLPPLPPPPSHHHHHHGGGPLLLESVVQKLQGARDTLTQLLDVASQPLPRGGLSGHVVLGLCNEAAPSPEAFIQFVACFRKLLHLPIVVLCADSDRFATLLQGVRQRLRQSCRLARHLIPPDTRDMYFVKGSPKNKADLHRCCVESAYAVVLLGDDVPRKREAGGDTDPVLQDRHVLLSCFKLEGILQQRLYSQVLTLVDLRNEVNMDMLRQRVRPTRDRGGSHQPAGSSTAGPKVPFTQQQQQHQQQKPCASSPPPTHVAIGVASSCSPPQSPGRPKRPTHSSTGHGRWDHHKDIQRLYHHPTHRRVHAHGRAHHPEDEPRLVHKQRPVDRATRPERGCPLFAAGRVCCRSFFDVLFVYLYKNPHALRFWKELIRSRMDDLATGEFQMGSGVIVRTEEDEDEEDEEDEDGAEAADEESVQSTVPEGYTGGRLFQDATGHAHAPADLEDLQDSIDALRSTLDMMPLGKLPAFLGLPYGELVDSLMALGVVAMGLYRPRGHMEATMPFSLVNPPASTILVRGDFVYVLRPGPLFDGLGPSAAAAAQTGGQASVNPGMVRRESSAPPEVAAAAQTGGQASVNHGMVRRESSAPPEVAGGGGGGNSGRSSPTVIRRPPPPPPSRYGPA